MTKNNEIVKITFDTPEIVKITFDIPERLREKFNKKLKKEGSSAKQNLIQHIKDYLKK